MGGIGSILRRAAIGVVLSAGTLIFEVLLAFAVYMWLAIAQVPTFGMLVRLASDVLRAAAQFLESAFPAFADQAYATLLGELGPKSALLLFIGLFSSGLIRLIRWILVGAMRRAGVGRGDGL